MVPPSAPLLGSVPVAPPSQSLPVPGKASYTLADLCRFDGTEFVENAFLCLVGRAPEPEERQGFVSMLAQGEVKPWILGEILRRIAGRPLGMVPGLRVRYLLQRLYRVPLIGGFVGWSVNLVRLPEVLRYQRAVEQQVRADFAVVRETIKATALQASRTDAESRSIVEQHVAELRTRLSSLAVSVDGVSATGAESTRRLDLLTAELAGLTELTHAIRSWEEALQKRTQQLAAQIDAGTTRTDSLAADLDSSRRAIEARLATNESDSAVLGAKLDSSSQAINARLGVIESGAAALGARGEALRGRVDELAAAFEFRVGFRPSEESIEQPVDDFLARAKATSAGLGFGVDVYGRDDVRYHLFEAAFYDSAYVGRKQRVYLRYIDRELCAVHPFLDLGCGRGEFLAILREEDIRAVGIDLSPINVDHLLARGFDVVLGEGVDYLQRGDAPLSGITAFQVIEHLARGELERLVDLAFSRLAPGGCLILETVNPHAPFAMGNFHMDETHVAPIPPERVAFLMQLAGFEDVRILYSTPVPGFAIAGPEARSHFNDFAVIGRRGRTGTEARG
jgi:SAM-dependent methyltransferase